MTDESTADAMVQALKDIYAPGILGRNNHFISTNKQAEAILSAIRANKIPGVVALSAADASELHHLLGHAQRLMVDVEDYAGIRNAISDAIALLPQPPAIGDDK